MAANFAVAPVCVHSVASLRMLRCSSSEVLSRSACTSIFICLLGVLTGQQPGVFITDFLCEVKIGTGRAVASNTGLLSNFIKVATNMKCAP